VAGAVASAAAVAIAAVAADEADSAGNYAKTAGFINIIYGFIRLHFKNFASKLRIQAMLTSFTGRLIATLPVVGIIGVVVSVPV